MNEDLLALRQIDFLPDRFRNAKEKRHASVWRLALAVVFAGMLSAAALYQYHLLRLARHELAQVDLMHQSATSLTKQLADAQMQLAPLDKVAQLLTYLSSPWPKSQLVAQAVADVPDSVTLRGLEIHFEKPPTSTAAHSAAPPEKDDAANKAPSAERDLKRLRQEYDGGKWVIVLTGSTSNLSELHIYLAALEHQPLFAKVELVSIEAAAAGSNQSQFVARIIVKPPHGNVAPSVVLSLRERKSAPHPKPTSQSATAGATASTAGLQYQADWHIHRPNYPHIITRSVMTTSVVLSLRERKPASHPKPTIQSAATGTAASTAGLQYHADWHIHRPNYPHFITRSVMTTLREQSLCS